MRDELGTLLYITKTLLNYEKRFTSFGIVL